MSLNPIELLEKAITEHGSAAVLTQHLAFAKAQYEALDRNAKELLTKVTKLEVKLEMEQAAHKETKQELQRLKDEHEEEIRIHRASGIEFRRGKRTSGLWSPFCPTCHSPAASPKNEYQLRCQNKNCGMTLLAFPRDVEKIAAELM